VLGNTKYMDSLYKKHWRTSIEQSGLSKEEILSGYERIKLDKEATLSQQLTWLRESGFSDVECVYKYYHFAVISEKELLESCNNLGLPYCRLQRVCNIRE